MPDGASPTLREASELLASGSATSLELETTLERIAATEPLVHAYANVMVEQALEGAGVPPRAGSDGSTNPIHGIPFAVKDVFWTHDAPTEAGSRILRGFVALRDAEAVKRLRRAGAVLVGKLVTHESCCGQDVPPTRNAWAATTTPAARAPARVSRSPSARR